MKLKGPHAGDGNYTYEAAFRFFERRKKSGIKGPTKKKVKKGKESGTPHVAGVKLEGEEDEYVPVYNICDIVYCEIAAYLRDPEVTQAAFLGKLAKMLSDPMANFQSEQLKDFQCKKGPLEGNSSRIYYTAYVFFESRGPYAESPKARSEKKTRTYGPGEAASIGRDKD
ncbi:hypothetical protein ABVK25_001406 [Lepraria finkii]|uniref:DUF7726 domain-containing protein n=1 Tax=Lepraria finkii TaxID=1340010 RepID=A0ABR4BLK8_9LECA